MMPTQRPQQELQDKAEQNTQNAHQTKVQKVIHSAYDLSLGISVVVAILIGVGLGMFMQKLSGSVWFLVLGIFWGIGAAILNIYKAYKRAQKEFEALAKDPKYSYKKQSSDT